MLEAKQEMSHYNEYQFLIINDDFDVAFNELRSLVTAERLRLERQAFEHADLIHSLIND
jgi:guanylate kinase